MRPERPMVLRRELRQNPYASGCVARRNRSRIKHHSHMTRSMERGVILIQKEMHPAFHGLIESSDFIDEL